MPGGDSLAPFDGAGAAIDERSVPAGAGADEHGRGESARGHRRPRERDDDAGILVVLPDRSPRSVEHPAAPLGEIRRRTGLEHGDANRPLEHAEIVERVGGRGLRDDRQGGEGRARVDGASHHSERIGGPERGHRDQPFDGLSQGPERR